MRALIASSRVSTAPFILFFTASLAVLLAGCPFVGGEVYQDRVRDMDGDDGIDEPFDTADCAY